MDAKDLEKVVLQGLEYEKVEKEKASERKALTRKNGLKPEDAKYMQGKQGQTRDIVAEKLGVSGKHWEHMKFVYRHKDILSDREYQDWKLGELSTTKAYTQLCKNLEYKKIIDKLIDSIYEVENEVLQYDKSYMDTEFKNKLADALFICKEEKRKDVNKSYEHLINEKHNFTKRQRLRLNELRYELTKLEKEIGTRKK